MENDEKSNEKMKLTRRKFVKACMGASAIAALGASSISLLNASLPPESVLASMSPTFRYYANKEEKKSGELWFVEKEGEDAIPEDFKIGRGASVIWMGRIPAILVRLEKEKFKNVIEGVVDDGDSVLVAFSAKCTHLCCLPNWQKSRPDFDKIYCPCHDSIFNPYDVVENEYKNEDNGEIVKYLGANRIAGPAPRALPMIPIEISDGKVMGLPTAFPWLAYCGIRV